MAENNNHFCVYCHTNKFNGKKYFGYTGKKPSARWNNGTGYATCTAFNRTIQKYGWDNFEHIIVADNLTHKEACELEVKLISEYNTIDRCNGYNIQLGGDGNGKVNDETKTKISKKAKERYKNKKNHPMYGKHHTKTSKSKISEAKKGRNCGDSNHFYGKKHTDEARDKISKSRIGKYAGDKNPSAKAVVQLDKENGEVIEVWGCMKYAADSLGLRVGGISNCCNGRGKTYGGYKWIKCDDYYEGGVV